MPEATRSRSKSATAIASHKAWVYVGGELNVESTNSTSRMPVAFVARPIASTTSSIGPRSYLLTPSTAA